MVENRRMRVLILAAGCDATDVGEAWSSYQWVSRLAKTQDVTLLTYRKRGRISAEEQLPGVRVVEWLDLPLLRRCDRFNSMLKPGYFRFYSLARRWIRRALQRGERFDLIHQLSPLAIRYPSAGVGWGVPLLVGPLAGSIETPEGFSSELACGRWYAKLRDLDRWRLRHDLWLRSTLKRADMIIGVAPYVQRLLGELCPRRFEVMSETGISALPDANPERFNRPGGVRLLCVGRVIRAKGVRDAVRALAHLRDLPGVTLDVVGDGDDLPACRREAAALNLNERIHFHGRLTRDSIDAHYARSDAFLFPSLREPSGNVVLEAMSHGLAMIVAANGGPGWAVTDACGYRIMPLTPEHYAGALAAAVREMVENPDRARAMGLAARQRIQEHYLWDSKVRWMCKLYDDIAHKEVEILQCAGAAI
jgi:glycosyltransferase involved in cell wall biosynthesis